MCPPSAVLMVTGRWPVGWVPVSALASIGGGILTHGLVSRWGEVFPSWVVGLAGRRVPPPLAVVPATVVAVVLVPAGFMNLRSPVTTDTWAVTAPGILWIPWGVALGAAALACRLRRQPPCAAAAAAVPRVVLCLYAWRVSTTIGRPRLRSALSLVVRRLVTMSRM